MLSYVWISSQKPSMCEKQWNGPRVCKCLTWRVFAKFTNAPFPGLTRRTNGRQSVCVCGGKGAQVQLELTDALCGIVQIMESTLSWSLLPLLHP